MDTVANAAASAATSIADVLVSLSTVLILLGTGLAVYIIRLFVPDGFEKTKLWRSLLRVLPILVGAGLALIPQLRPTGATAPDLIIGGFWGSMSASTYEFLREALGEKVKALIGSPQRRKRESQLPPEP